MIMQNTTLLSELIKNVMCLSSTTSLITLDIHSSQNDYRFKQEILFHNFMTYMKENL